MLSETSIVHSVPFAPWTTALCLAALLLNGQSSGYCAADDPDGLVLSIAVHKRQIIQYEPVVLTVSIANRSRQDKKVVAHLDPSWGFLSLFVDLPTGRRCPIRPFVQSCGQARYVTLSSGQQIHHRFYLLYSKGVGYIFKEKGRYRVHVRFRPGTTGSRFVSATSPDLFVSAPTKEVDEYALRHWRGGPQALFALGLTTDNAIAREFSTVARKFPGSTYAPWSYYFCGRAALRQELNDGPSKGGLNGVLVYYRPLLDKYPKFPLRMEAKLDLAEIYYYLGKTDVSTRILKEIESKHRAFVAVRRSIARYMQQREK